MELTVRQATEKDTALLNSLAAQIWEPTYGAILSKEQLDYMFEMMYSEVRIAEQIMSLGHTYLIAFADGVPCGYISFEPVAKANIKPDSHGFIFQKIYCLPSMQGKGIGRYLVNEGIKHLKRLTDNAPLEIELYVNRENPAVSFYEHIGFRKSGVRDHYIGNGYYMNDYIMKIIC
jgi:ribosomal protein S18 acetylase RimI-like enzyme